MLRCTGMHGRKANVVCQADHNYLHHNHDSGDDTCDHLRNMGREEMKTILKQYADMRAEQQDLIRRIQSLDARILNMEMNTIVSDTVTRGKKGKQSLGTVRIEGFPSRDYQKRKRTLRRYKQLLSDFNDDLMDKQSEVEQYIQSIDDPYIRQAIRYRYIDGLSWLKVGKQMHTTEDAIRKAVSRFIGDEN